MDPSQGGAKVSMEKANKFLELTQAPAPGRASTSLTLFAASESTESNPDSSSDISRSLSPQLCSQQHGECEEVCGVDAGRVRSLLATRPSGTPTRGMYIQSFRHQRHPSRPSRTRTRCLYSQGPSPPH
ncbi:hypothetical protein C1H46_045385 [Malus baccata]|uniref:Uncharacterized protein n=1 Tax=Malus baccata TaxID=106549 RepID=A0A540K5C0_MALBA|nr:hypothetical protein C1H46_045385 [Malus baccata]